MMTSVLPSSLVIATRESRLAMWQASYVQAKLQQLGHGVTLLGMTTLGDQILDRQLSQVGGKGLFVKELEMALQDKRADLAVHSLKDVPMELPKGFELACVMKREDPRDAWVSAYDEVEKLPLNAIIGTSSLRRMVLLKEHLMRIERPDIRIQALRGNLDTRLQKLDQGHYHAIVLAVAGLKRLGLSSRIAHVFDIETMVPSPGQGALGIEVCQDREDVRQTLQALHDESTFLCVEAERAVSRFLGGSCSVPLGAHAYWVGEEMCLQVVWSEAKEEDQHPVVIRVQQSQKINTLEQARQLGATLASSLRR